MTPTRIFIDYWNFQLAWKRRCQKSCDWAKLPNALVASAASIAPQFGALRLDDVRVYASVNPDRPSDGKLRNWLETFLDRQPGFRVFIRERKSRVAPIHCRSCNKETADCPNCHAKLERAVEKGVDSAILTDMFSLAWEHAYDVAILVTSDADMKPAVEKIQDKGPKIINATWTKAGHELAKTCWASFDVDPLLSQLSR